MCNLGTRRCHSFVDDIVCPGSFISDRANISSITGPLIKPFDQNIVLPGNHRAKWNGSIGLGCWFCHLISSRELPAKTAHCASALAKLQLLHTVYDPVWSSTALDCSKHARPSQTSSLHQNVPSCHGFRPILWLDLLGDPTVEAAVYLLVKISLSIWPGLLPFKRHCLTTLSKRPFFCLSWHSSVNHSTQQFHFEGVSTYQCVCL